MRKLKIQKGITLIALVVTIIVLLILAGVSISMLTGQNGILNRAGEAKEGSRGGDIQERIALTVAENTSAQFLGGTKQTREEVITKLHNEGKLTDSEVETLADYDTITIGGITVDFSALGKIEWEYDHETQTVKKGTQKLNIGDYIEDKGTQTVEGFDGKWRVLGAQDGQLLLISATYYAPFEEDSSNGLIKGGTGPSVYGLRLSGQDGYDNAVDRLNKVSAQYNNSKLEKARSVTVEDINTITGYNPNEARIDSSDLTKKGPYGSGSIDQYQNKVTYEIKADGYVYYKGDKAVTTETKSSETKFWLPGTSSNITKPFTIQSTYYFYYSETLSSLTSSIPEGQEVQGIAKISAAYDMLFKTPYTPYWLASPCVRAGEADNYAEWGLFIGPSSHVIGNYLWSSFKGSRSSTFGVRPVVSLKSDIRPSFKSIDDETKISTYEIE